MRWKCEREKKIDVSQGKEVLEMHRTNSADRKNGVKSLVIPGNKIVTRVLSLLR